MVGYLLRRLLGTIPILFGVIFLTFMLLQLIPGDPATVLAGERATPEQIEQIREELGLNDPILVQFGRYIWNLAQLDLGRSLLTNRPVTTEIAERLPATVELALSAMLIGAFIGLTLGVIAAWNKQTFWDTFSMLLALAGVSIPVFWLGLEFIYYFSYQMLWFPTSGRGDFPGESITGLFVLDSLLTFNFAALSKAFSHLALPAITLGLYTSALIARMTRSSLVQVLEQDFIRTARAKGTNRLLLLRHTFMAGFVPVLTIMGLQLGMLLGGAILTEHVFSWPGLGSFMVQAVFARDFPSIQALVLVAAVTFVGANLAVDLIAALFDPRIRERLGQTGE